MLTVLLGFHCESASGTPMLESPFVVVLCVKVLRSCGLSFTRWGELDWIHRHALPNEPITISKSLVETVPSPSKSMGQVFTASNRQLPSS